MSKKVILFLLFIISILSWITAEKYIFQNRYYCLSGWGYFEFTDTYFKYVERDDPNEEPPPVIEGTYKVTEDQGFLIIHVDKYSFITYYFEHTVLLHDQNYNISLCGSLGYGASGDCNMFPFYHCEASSFLTETLGGKKIKYGPENLKNYDITKPWVIPNGGIGDYLKAEVRQYEETDWIIIANGYIDQNNLDLYYQNNRVKKILIQSEDPAFEKYYELKDTYNLQLLELPKETNKLKLIIKDVYKGTKYNDTCLAGVFYLNRRIPAERWQPDD